MSTALGNSEISKVSDPFPPGTTSTLSDSSDADKNAVNDPDGIGVNGRHFTVQELAHDYMCQSAVSLDDPNGIVGNNDSNSPLNPHGEKFSARAWAKAIAKVASDGRHGFRRVGLCIQDLNVFGYGTPTDFQKDVGNVWLTLPGMARRLFSRTAGQKRIDILRQFDGLIRPGEMCVVLGPPGSGCSTFLKTIAGETNGIYVNQGSYCNYQGISANEMHTAHRGDAIYTAEVDVHFPQLTVGETLTFASRARCQRELPQGISRNRYVTRVLDVPSYRNWTLTPLLTDTASTFETSLWPCMALAIPSIPRWETSIHKGSREENASVSLLPRQRWQTLHFSVGISE